jgi:hypothetical protein
MASPLTALTLEHRDDDVTPGPLFAMMTVGIDTVPWSVTVQDSTRKSEKPMPFKSLAAKRMKGQSEKASARTSRYRTICHSKIRPLRLSAAAHPPERCMEVFRMWRFLYPFAKWFGG